MYVCMYIIILNVGISTNHRLLLIYVCMYLFLYIFMYVFMYAIILVYICILGYSSFFLHFESVVLFTCLQRPYLQPPRSCDSDGKPSSHSVSNATAGNEINNLISMKLLIEILYFLFGLSGAWTDEPQLKQKKSNSLLKVFKKIQ